MSSSSRSLGSPCSGEVAVHCLASGSSANALLVIAGDDALLVDAGLGVRRLRTEIEKRGIAPERLSGILLTHEHIDHVRGAIPFARRYKVPLFSTAGTLETLFAQERRDAPYQILPAGGEVGVGSFGVRSVSVTHDAVDPVGFRVSFGDTALAYATDTGTVTPEFREACVGASLIAIESNHDIHKLRFGPYPDSLKARILGRHGHLSNNAACDLILSHASEQGPACFWLSHLSEINNTPRMAMNYWKKRAKAAGLLPSGKAGVFGPAVVEVALRDQPSLVYRTRTRAVQLALF
ncbi:MAG: MBL fold metallo-hydrolase [Cytophagales bacterium]|nr:MBL fold metallo-hydrolase [Armatimonadota bacterium]